MNKSCALRKKFFGSLVLLLLPLDLPATQAGDGKFEVVSIKRTGECTMQNSIDPGRIALIGDPLKVLLREGYSVKLDQIIGPSWLDEDCYAVIAKIPAGATKDQLPAMYRALLADYFKIVTHTESRPRPGYALVVDENGLKLKASDPDSSIQGARAGAVRFGAAPTEASIKGSMTMASLARNLGNRLKVPVEDSTGLDGKYDVDVKWVPDPTIEKLGPFAQDAARMSGAAGVETSAPPAGVNIFAALKDSLGLRLEPRKEQVEVVVVDHIERVPVGN